ncbi:MAG: hypothetical protein H0U99_09645 [Chthoniobacterales bacterium]|nr:hypothetical protein [Chthoniobacterales bacterium]
MTRQTYSIFVRNRPTRHGFLFDGISFPSASPCFDELVDRIIDCADGAWGGRRWHLLPHRGETLADSTWQLLEALDVDYLHAFSPLAPALLTALNERVSPVVLDAAKRSSPPVGPSGGLEED